MHPPVVQAFLQWQQALSVEDRAALDAFLVDRNGRPDQRPAAASLRFGGRRQGQTPTRPVDAASAQGACPTCGRPLP